jgi:hypothetical protein
MLGFAQSVKKFAGHSLLEAIQMWHNITRPYCDDGDYMATTWLGEDVWREMESIVKSNCITTKQKRFEVGDFTRIPNGTGDLGDHLSMLSTAANAVSAERETTASRKAERTGIPASGV